MDAPRIPTKLALLVSAALLALSVLAAPAVAVDEPPEGGTTQQEEESGRPAVADTPRSQFALLMYVALGAFAVGGAMTFSRQLKGERPQATGEFRWR